MERRGRPRSASPAAGPGAVHPVPEHDQGRQRAQVRLGPHGGRRASQVHGRRQEEGEKLSGQQPGGSGVYTVGKNGRKTR